MLNKYNNKTKGGKNGEKKFLQEMIILAKRKVVHSAKINEEQKYILII